MYESLYPVAIEEKDFNEVREMIRRLLQWQGTLEDATILLLAQRYLCPI